MKELAQKIAQTFSQKLGTHLDAVYLYGSLTQGHYRPNESDVNMLVVVADGTSMHTIRAIFLPIWKEHQAVLRRAPLVATQTAFKRHMNLNPVLAHHLATSGQQLLGLPDLLDDLPPLDPREAYAYLAAEAMQASAAVAPDMLEPEVAEARLQQLRRLARRLSGQPIPQEQTADHILSQIHHYLKQKMDDTPEIQPWVSPKRPTTSLLLPSLDGTFKELGGIVMSFGNLTPHQVVGTNWQDLSKQLAKHYSGLCITTSTQFRLIVEFETPLSLAFDRYEHEWGLNVLDAVEARKWLVLRDAARTPSAVQIDSFPNAYLTADNDQMGKLIHDFQNKLLNVQLEHELLHRIQQIERFTPPQPLPNQETSSMLRINAIFKHLDWWAEYYANQMANYA